MDATHIVGTSVRRVDGQPKVLGQSRYAADIQMPGMLHCRLVPSTFAHARIVRIDTSAALAVPGVVAVVAGHELNLPGLNPNSRPKMPMARGETFFRGQPVAAVLAESESAASDGAALVDVEYEELPIVADAEAAMAEDAPLVRPLPKNTDEGEASAHATVTATRDEANRKPANVADSVHFSRGDVAQGFAEADVVVERTYKTPMVHQSYLEPRALVAAPDPMGGGVTIWTSTQGIFYCRSEVAQALGLSESEVKIVATTVGGGFGAKICVLEPLVAALALEQNRPVRLVYSRSDEFLNPTPAPSGTLTVKLGARRDGTFTALQVQITFDAGAFPGAPTGIGALLVGSVYKVANLDVRGQELLSHKPGPGAYRAPGSVQASFALESTVDQLARELGIDPLELRLRNCVEQGDPLASGEPWALIGLRQCLETMRSQPEYQNGNGHTDEGIGIAVGAWPGGLEPANAICRMNRDGTLTIQVGSVDISGSDTTLSQIAAEAFGVEMADIKLVHGDTDSAPNSGMAGGSKIVYTVGEAVRRAAVAARTQLLKIAADRLEVSADDLDVAEGRVRVRGTDKSISLKEIAQISLGFGSKYESVSGHGASATHERAPGFAVHLARVKVDRETGAIAVTDYVAVQDVGKAINPAELEGQVAGGVTQGLGWALFEQMLYDGEGQLQTGTFADYALPLAIDVPNIRSVFVEIPSLRGPYGARGIGEPPVVPPLAAVANAVAAAVGVRISELPITSEKLLRGLGTI